MLENRQLQSSQNYFQDCIPKWKVTKR